MNSSDIISVDPGQNTLGSLHSGFSENALRSSVITNSDEISLDKDLINFVFSYSPNLLRHGMSIFVVRLLFAVSMITFGCLLLNGVIHSSPSHFSFMTLAPAQIIIGAMIALGFLTRFATFAGFAGFGYLAINSVTTGTFDIFSMAFCLGCLVLLMIGSGKYSADFLIRRAILAFPMRRKAKIAQHRLSYKAYRYSPYR